MIPNSDSLQTMSLSLKLFKTVSFPINFLKTMLVFKKVPLVFSCLGMGFSMFKLVPVHFSFLFLSFFFLNFLFKKNINTKMISKKVKSYEMTKN